MINILIIVFGFAILGFIVTQSMKRSEKYDGGIKKDAESQENGGREQRGVQEEENSCQ